MRRKAASAAAIDPTATAVAAVAGAATAGAAGWSSALAHPALSPRGAAAVQLREYVALAKPRIGLMVLISAAVGFCVAEEAAVRFDRLGLAVLGIGLLATASSILNQWMERHTDARMPRTSKRPLPRGAIAPQAALALGLACAVVGAGWLLAFVNELTALLTTLTCLLYVGVYTPLKRSTPLCTAVGAIPGAMPLVLGWTAAGAPLDGRAASLFSILFLWQFPHFLAIAWLYRGQYAQAGLKMLPQGPLAPRIVGLSAIAHAAALIPVSLWARTQGLSGDAYALCAVVLGAWYLAAAVRFADSPEDGTARKLLWTSLGYLPMLLAALTIDHFRMLR